MTTHAVRMNRHDYDELVESDRSFDVQFNNAGFTVGDQVHFIESDSPWTSGNDTGRMIARTVSLVVERSNEMPLRVREGLRVGYCLIGLAR